MMEEHIAHSAGFYLELRALVWRSIVVFGILVGLFGIDPSLVHFEELPKSSRDLSEAQREIAGFILGYAERYALDPALLRAIIHVESNFNPMAVSPKGARGLMQLMPVTAAALHVLNPFDPGENIRAGAEEIRRLLNRFDGDVRLALAAYHAGESRVVQSVGIPPLKSTQTYIEKVLQAQTAYVAKEREAIQPYTPVTESAFRKVKIRS